MVLSSNDSLEYIAAMRDQDVVAANIARLRKERGMSQAALADAMQEAGATWWHQNTVSRIERGTQVVTFKDLPALTAVLPGVFSGTDLHGVSQAPVRSVERSLVLPRLHRVEQGLEAALAEVRELQYAFGEETSCGTSCGYSLQ